MITYIYCLFRKCEENGENGVHVLYDVPPDASNISVSINIIIAYVIIYISVCCTCTVPIKNLLRKGQQPTNKQPLLTRDIVHITKSILSY